jgi:maltooligosyltrehalose trehalohydrolase
MLFMGEEWGASTPWQFFTGYPDPELARAVREGRRREFSRHGWRSADVPDPQDPATRDASVLDWAELSVPPHEELLAWYRALLALRRAEPDLRDDDLARVGVQYSAADGWLVLARGAFRVVVNLSDAPRLVPLDAAPTAAMLAWGDVELSADGVRLPAQSAVVLSVT